MTAPNHHLESWRQAAVSELKGRPLEALTRASADGFTIPPLFTAEDLSRAGGIEPPGCAPFVRGIDALPSPWRMAVHVDVDDLIGGLGVDLTTAFLHLAPDFMDVHRIDRLAEMLRAAGLEANALHGAIQFDPLGEAIEGDTTEPWQQTLMESAAALRHAAATLPGLRTIQVRGARLAERAASPATELALSLCMGIEYLRHAHDLGIAIDLAAAQMSFQFAVGSQILSEIAKLRAARGLWAKVVQAFGVVHKHSEQMHVESCTALRTITKRDPHVNLIRATLQTMAAAMGGARAIAIDAFDLRTERSTLGERLARNQHWLLQYEAHLDKVVDPLGGAFAIEALTDRIGRAAWQKLQAIEAMGGFTKALVQGHVGALLDDSAKCRRNEVLTGERPLIGTSLHVSAPPPHGIEAAELECFDSAVLDALAITSRERGLRYQIEWLDTSLQAREQADRLRDLFGAAGLDETHDDKADVIGVCGNPTSTAWAAVAKRPKGRHVATGETTVGSLPMLNSLADLHTLVATLLDRKVRQ